MLQGDKGPRVSVMCSASWAGKVGEGWETGVACFR